MIFFRCNECGGEYEVRDALPGDKDREIPQAYSYLFHNELFFTDGKAPCHICRGDNHAITN